jgi:hypothetical protein
VVRGGVVETRPERRSTHDKSLSGYKKLLKSDATEAARKADLIIKNTYRTLMTRGIKGCYVYFTDRATEQHVKSRLASRPRAEALAMAAEPTMPYDVPLPPRNL